MGKQRENLTKRLAECLTSRRHVFGEAQRVTLGHQGHIFGEARTRTSPRQRKRATSDSENLVSSLCWRGPLTVYMMAPV